MCANMCVCECECVCVCLSTSEPLLSAPLPPLIQATAGKPRGNKKKQRKHYEATEKENSKKGKREKVDQGAGAKKVIACGGCGGASAPPQYTLDIQP